MDACPLPASALTQLPFRAAAEAWLESRRPYISGKTHHEYQLNIKTLSAFFGELRLQEIDADLLRAYHRMRSERCGPFAINHECGLILQMRKRIGMPVTDYQPLPLPKEERGRALSEEERARLLRVAQSNENWEAAYLFASISVNTTAGPKETFTLRLKDIDIERRSLRVQPGGSKNVHRTRTIPLNDEALSAVMLASNRAKRLGATEPEHYLFPFRIKRNCYDPARHQTTFKTAWKRVLDAAHIQNFRMYDLRHHAMTALLENPDVSEETVEDIAGHISKKMKKRYSHIRMRYKRAAVEGIGRKPIQREVSPAKSTDEDVAKQLVTLLSKLLKTA